MSPPSPIGRGCLWAFFGLIFGGAAWFLWRNPWLAAAAGAVLGFASLIVAVAVGKSPPEPGRRAPGDPRP